MNSPKTKRHGGHAIHHSFKHNHFDVLNEPPHRQLLAWRDRVGHVIDVLPSIAQLEQPFHASIDRYQIGDAIFTDCSSDAMLLDRSIARISTDNKRDYLFHVFTEGGIDFIKGINLQPRKGHALASIIMLDQNQPIRMHRSTCRVLTLFVPRSMVEGIFPEAESLHGRTLENTTPLTQLLIEQIVSLTRNLPVMSKEDTENAIRHGTQLLVAAFTKQANMSGSVRAAVRAAMFARTRNYIRAHLHQPTLTPENVIDALQLSRASVYRLFEHEGGLAAYIRNCRLQEAANELVRFPNLSVIEIAYGLGFKSASDFGRAFRRIYEMTPQDMRMTGLQRLSNGAPSV